MTEEFKMVPEDQLTKSQKEFIGTQFPTPKGGVLTVIGVVGKDKSGVALFSVDCSICSQDSELWPEGSITTTKGSLIRENIPCGCSKYPQWTETQNKTRVQRECGKRGYTFHGWFGKYNGNKTRLILSNNLTGSCWNSTVMNSFFCGHGDPENRIKTITKDDINHIKQFMSTGKFPNGTLFTRNKNIKNSRGEFVYWDVFCPVCSTDEYVRFKVCEGVFTTHISSLKRGVKSCRCSHNYRYTQKQREYQVTKVLLDMGTFKGWHLNNFTNNNMSKIEWICQKGHHCITSVNRLLGGVRCPTCATRGFSPSNPAWFYIVQWQGFGESYIKYGITNHENYMTRIKQQASKSKLDYKIIATYRSESGQLCLDAENKLKYDILKDQSGACPKDWLPDGYSETVEDTPEHLEIILRVADEIIK